ncbi:hypothetical protein A3F08_01675 [Candidatus Berkelbacteria bacterium RIFCSPHIGHO2_12_FULL_36_9]|uniref:Glycosyl transferase family 1 domain-containing protein n=1 Tax=Candidatus Berkelbacteria bacterium RIFCSPHIGHO2_12_FULL_36_9 TaxID=1797469 RepID=A0A1F5EEC0_9BACT|nr:MAG: hypothetical protein A3F08_01675 [Candidatus Berkelbacteria bacterium RIFCSPHIGHO2_12_FULL_36_9]
MKVAFVHEFLTQLGGAEKVLEALCELFPDPPIYTLVYDKNKTGAVFGKRDIRTSFVQKLPFGISKYKWYLVFYPKAIESFDLSEYDLIISDSSAFAKGAIRAKNAVHICYCHTPTRYLWQIPDFYVKTAKIPWPITKIMPMVLNWLKKWDFKAAQRPDHFIANSQEVQERIKTYYHRDSEIIYPFVDFNQFALSKNTKNYYLLAGRIVPYKRYDIVIRAFDKLGLPLKVVGSGYGLEDLKKIAKSDKIEFVGWVPDSEKIKYLGGAKALIFPAEEDFGIVMLEAMASGCPVIAFKKAGALEIVREGINGMFFDNQTSESVIEAIKKFNPKRFDPRLIRQSSLKFDKKIFQEKIKKFILGHINM